MNKIDRDGNYMRMDGDSDEELENFYSDEEQEDFEAEKSDMNSLVDDLNKRIEKLFYGIRRAEEILAEKKSGDSSKVTSKIG